MPSPPFVTTRWTLVLRARGDSPEARDALAQLCELYYAPVEAFVRLQVTDAEEARDLTQDFFARLLAGRGFAGAEAGRGRFRSYVLGAVKHHLHADRIRREALKRGAGRDPVSLDAPDNETTIHAPGAEAAWADSRATTADRAFDRRWAQVLLERALDTLSRLMAAEGKSDAFEVLNPCLLGTTAPPPQTEMGARLGLGESAIKVAIHRLRKRFREVVRAEIAATLADPGQVDEEMRHLLEALSDPDAA